jgi:hypothetical protein
MHLALCVFHLKQTPILDVWMGGGFPVRETGKPSVWMETPKQTGAVRRGGDENREGTTWKQTAGCGNFVPRRGGEEKRSFFINEPPCISNLESQLMHLRVIHGAVEGHHREGGDG